MKKFLLLLLVLFPAYGRVSFFVHAPHDGVKTLDSIVKQRYHDWHIYCVTSHDNNALENFIKSQDSSYITVITEPSDFMRVVYTTVHELPDDELVCVLKEDDILAHNQILKKITATFKAHPGTWWCSTNYMVGEYHKFSLGSTARITFKKSNEQAMEVGYPHFFRASLFKSIPLNALLDETGFFKTHDPEWNYIKAFAQLGTHNYQFLREKAAICRKRTKMVSSYSLDRHLRALSLLPEHKRQAEHVSLIVFSKDRPLELYSFLESTVKYVRGSYSIHVIYYALKQKFEDAYQGVQKDFPSVKFHRQERVADFKKILVDILKYGSGKYVLFAVDDLIVKDKVDLNECVRLLEQTQAYGVYLRLGTHLTHHYYFPHEIQPVPPSLELYPGIFVWKFNQGKRDWCYPHSVDFTLLRKKDIIKDFMRMAYRSPNTLESEWQTRCDVNKLLGIYYELAKVVNLPLNRVNDTFDNRHMGFATPEDLLNLFNQNLKIDIKPYYKMKNTSCHSDTIPPTFIPRS